MGLSSLHPFPFPALSLFGKETSPTASGVSWVPRQWRPWLEIRGWEEEEAQLLLPSLSPPLLQLPQDRAALVLSST